MPQVDLLTFFNLSFMFCVFFTISYNMIYSYCVNMEKVSLVREVLSNSNKN